MKFYSTKEFAEMIGVSSRTLRRWDKNGLLKAKRTPTNRLVYSQNDYENYIKKLGERKYEKNKKKY